MKADKYTLEEVKSKLTAAGAPAVPTAVTAKDELRTAITETYVSWVEDYYWHTFYEKENYKIVSQVNRFSAALQDEVWSSTTSAANVSDRDNLIDKNQDLRNRLALSPLVPASATPIADQYCLDPFVEPRIKQGLDFDEARACGGTCHSTDPDLAYHIVDLPVALSSGGYIVADISQQQYEEWRDELQEHLREEDLSTIRIRAQEENDAWGSTRTAVNDFRTNWTAAGGTRDKILDRKEKVLKQRLVEAQIRNIEQSNRELRQMIKEGAGEDIGLTASEGGSGVKDM